jgi:glycosyltransferase involved in cell wall biosynthesis
LKAIAILVKGGRMRIWILARHLPPEVSGGVRRPVALAIGLRKRGHDVTIIGPNGAIIDGIIGVPHPVFPAVASSAPRSNSQNIDLPLRARALDWARRWLLLPDPEIRWAVRCVTALRQLSAKVGSPDWLITTSPPESLHVAGRMAAKTLDCKWLADVRDLWIERPQRRELEQSFMRRWLEGLIARATLSKANAISAVSPIVLREALRLAGPSFDANCGAVIGHFAEPFEGAETPLPLDTFNIVHTGSIGLSNPLSQLTPLLAAFCAVHAKRPEARLYLAGNLNNQEQDQIAKGALTSAIIYLGSVSRDEARALQAGSDALAIVSGPLSHALPGKFAEYQTTGRPILLAGAGPWRALVENAPNIHEFEAAITLEKRTGLPTEQAHNLQNDGPDAIDQFVALMRKAV